MFDPKSKIAEIPGVLIAHRLLKNLKHYLNSHKSTIGGIRRAGMSVDEAVAYAQTIFERIDNSVSQAGGWNGKRVLEVGPGDSLGTGLLCISRGAASYCAVDRFAVGMDFDFERQVFGKLFEAMNSEQQENCTEIIDHLKTHGTFLENQIEYRNNLPIEKAPNIPGFGLFDVIFSNAVLEHVADLPGTIRAFSKLLSPKGVMQHDVDLRSHQTYEKHPLQFLEYPQWLWRLMSSHNGEPNRIRVPQYLELLEENGISPVEIVVTKFFDPQLITRVRPKLCPLFRDIPADELKAAVFNFTFFKS